MLHNGTPSSPALSQDVRIDKLLHLRFHHHFEHDSTVTNHRVLLVYPYQSHITYECYLTRFLGYLTYLCQIKNVRKVCI